jgi:hypothetical protein
LTFKKNKLRPILSETFDGIIWKIEINEKQNLIAIESRSLESRKVSFSVINYNTGEILLKEQSFQEPWNLNLAYIDEKVLIIIIFNPSESPETRGIMSVNIQNAEVLWERYNLSLHQVNDFGLQVFDPKISPRRLSWINHLNGEIITEVTNYEYIKQPILLPKVTNQITFPDFILKEELVGDLSVLHFRNQTIISFHEKINTKIHQRLIVYQDSGILIDEILIRDIQKLQPESFFIQKNHLFYVRNKNEIVSYLV